MLMQRVSGYQHGITQLVKRLLTFPELLVQAELKQSFSRLSVGSYPNRNICLLNTAI